MAENVSRMGSRKGMDEGYLGLLPKDEEIRHELYISRKQLADIKKYAFLGKSWKCILK